MTSAPGTRGTRGRRIASQGRGPGKALDLRVLGRGCPALTPSFGSSLCEAAAVCLDDEHTPGASLGVTGAVRDTYVLDWPPANDQARRTYNDPEVATELGAYGVAILVLRDQTGLTVVERSRRGTGFDYWLGDDEDLLFQKKARLEVSGVRKGRGRVAGRVKKKIKQTKRSDSLRLRAFVVVVEFGAPAVAYEVRP